MASPLRNWLKKEDIYDPDLEQALKSQNINDPSDFQNVSQSQWDEIWRISVVERAKDLKDQKSKVRLEKRMKKLEKYWRKESGIKSTSINKFHKTSNTKQSYTNASKSANTSALKKANALKKYLQKNDCFDKDLVLILSNMDIFSENDLHKIDANKKYDNIHREIRVLRAKELKDNTARLRLEKLMSKFEKLWRKKTGIKKKSSQTSKNKSKKNKKDPTTSKNDEYESKGKELKNWMKKNKVWEKTLYDELMSNNVKTDKQLKNLNTNQFDDIVRKVRVDRFSQLKDKQSRNRADKLLISFEKQWRKSSGIRSTSIKVQNHHGKSVTPSPRRSPRSKSPMSGAKSDNEKEEIMPWYLSGKQKKRKNAALASNPRTVHQKKKDNKLNNKLRESVKIEAQWIEIYSLAKYGAYTAPKIEDKYSKRGKKEQKEAEQDEKDAEDEKKTDLIPDLHAIDIDFEEIVVDVCIEMLLILDESWEGRISILNAFINQLCNDQCTDDIYALKMCKFLCAIGVQFTDPRSLIIQAMEQCISKLAETTPDRFILFAPYILTSLFATFPVRIEALRDPGIKLGNFLIATLIQYDVKHELLRTVFNGLDSKHAAVRTECANYMDLMIRSIGLLEKEDVSDEEKMFLAEIDESIKKACKDAASEARMNGYRALNRFKNIAPNAAQDIIEKMTKAQSTKYQQANESPHFVESTDIIDIN